MLPNLQSALEGTTFPWSLCLVGEDQSRKLAELLHDLRRPYSDSGAGKRITSGYPYWGVDPTVEWVRACGDPFYPVMKAGIESFVHRWVKLQDALEDRPYHYVSLGPGTGHKDRTVIEALRRGNPSLCYVSVDMSAEMLRLGVHEPIRSLGLQPGRVIPVQIDFSVAENLFALRTLLTNLLGDAPIVFSLLGNTLANFDDDVELLQMLVQYLLNSDDRMILEVATTQSLGPDLADRAAEEYRGSDSFTVFVTSALQNYTDLTIDLGNVAFRGSVEDERAIKVDVIYQNQADTDLQIALPGYFGPPTPFRRNDTVLLYITRKYTPAGLRELVEAAEVVIAAEVPWRMGGRDRGDGGGFGVGTLVLQPAEHRVGAP
jgi:L-histidine N-alpha-methyltransferase